MRRGEETGWLWLCVCCCCSEWRFGQTTDARTSSTRPLNPRPSPSVLWLEQFLARFSGTVVAVTHDRYFLNNVAGWILELDRGKGLPHEGNYESWLEAKVSRLAQEKKEVGGGGGGGPARN